MAKILALQQQSFQCEYSGLISFRIDWFDLLAVHGTLKSLLQLHSSKASIFQHSAFFMVQLSIYITTGKTIALTRWTFVSKMMSLLFNTLSRFIITFFFFAMELARFNFMAALTVPSDFGILQARILEWVAFPFSRASSNPGIKPRSSALQADSLSTELSGKPLHIWGYWYFSQQSWFQLITHPAQYFPWCTLHIS